MSEKKTRVLARTNARELAPEEIEMVSGGRMPLYTWCGNPLGAKDDDVN